MSKDVSCVRISSNPRGSSLMLRSTNQWRMAGILGNAGVDPEGLVGRGVDCREEITLPPGRDL